MSSVVWRRRHGVGGILGWWCVGQLGLVRGVKIPEVVRHVVGKWHDVGHRMLSRDVVGKVCIGVDVGRLLGGVGRHCVLSGCHSVWVAVGLGVLVVMVLVSGRSVPPVVGRACHLLGAAWLAIADSARCRRVCATVGLGLSCHCMWVTVGLGIQVAVRSMVLVSRRSVPPVVRGALDLLVFGMSPAIGRGVGRRVRCCCELRGRCGGAGVGVRLAAICCCRCYGRFACPLFTGSVSFPGTLDFASWEFCSPVLFAFFVWDQLVGFVVSASGRRTRLGRSFVASRGLLVCRTRLGRVDLSRFLHRIGHGSHGTVFRFLIVVSFVIVGVLSSFLLTCTAEMDIRFPCSIETDVAFVMGVVVGLWLGFLLRLFFRLVVGSSVAFLYGFFARVFLILFVGVLITLVYGEDLDFVIGYFVEVVVGGPVLLVEGVEVSKGGLSADRWHCCIG